MSDRTTVPYQVYVDKKIRVKAVEKAKASGSNLNAFMAMAMEQFIDRPIEDSMKALRKHNRRKHKDNE